MFGLKSHVAQWMLSNTSLVYDRGCLEVKMNKNKKSRVINSSLPSLSDRDINLDSDSQNDILTHKEVAMVI